MGVIILLIIASIVVAGSFLAAFIWAVKSGQYDDTYSPSVRVLFEDKKKKKPTVNQTQKERKGNDQ